MTIKLPTQAIIDIAYALNSAAVFLAQEQDEISVKDLSDLVRQILQAHPERQVAKYILSEIERIEKGEYHVPEN